MVGMAAQWTMVWWWSVRRWWSRAQRHRLIQAQGAFDDPAAGWYLQAAGGRLAEHDLDVVSGGGDRDTQQQTEGVHGDVALPRIGAEPVGQVDGGQVVRPGG